jgi:hypothetical protein
MMMMWVKVAACESLSGDIKHFAKTAKHGDDRVIWKGTVIVALLLSSNHPQRHHE